jgi:chromosome partitioning protein
MSSHGKTPEKSGKKAARCIAVSLLKGGVAKTGTSVHLAHGLAQLGKQVLLVDTDVQAQCGEMLGCQPDKGLAQVICGLCEPFQGLVQARENLFLLAGGNDLAGVKLEIGRREIAPEAVLSETLKPYLNDFDYIIFDTAPGWDTLLVNALYAVDDVLAPVSMEPMAVSGLKRFEERLSVIQKYNSHLKLRWVVPTFVDRRVRKSANILRQLMEEYGAKVAPPVMYSSKLSETTALGRTIYESDPLGTGARDYMRLSQRVLKDAPPLSSSKSETPPAPIEKRRTILRPINGFKRHGLRARLKQAEAEQEPKAEDLAEITALLKS